MELYNTLKREKEKFIPLKNNEVKIYACGPTVYNYIHIGNARPLCVFDVLRRFLEHQGMKVTYVQNFTDIDDKIIKKAIEDKCSYSDVSKKYIQEYKKDAKGLNIREATYHPLATENIDEIIKIISKLIETGHAYKSADGDVYFRTKSFEHYGKLSHQPLDDLEAGARIEIGEQKENPMDFVLWKSAKPGEPVWNSPWGNGRPGWHIECSAMAKRYLGDTIDIHCGGQDLIFPHHENEIAQSECANQHEFARYWLHNGYINIENKKMSKSLNNFFTVRDVAEKHGYGPIRYLMIASHYRSPINYSEDIIKQCASALERLKNCRENLDFLLKNSENSKKDIDHNTKKLFDDYMNKFVEALNDDLNTADALAVLFEFTKDLNTKFSATNSPSEDTIEYAIEVFDKMCWILGIESTTKTAENDSDEEVQDLLQRRNLARQNKNWSEADRLRDELKKRGYIIEDTPQGAKLKKL